MTGPEAAEQTAKKLRSSLRTAIMITNLIGMPVLVVFMGAILGLTATNLATDFKLDPLFMPYNFSVLLVIALSFVFIHYFHMIKAIEPGEKYLAEREATGNKPDRELAVQALRASEDFPYLTMRWSIIYYFIGAPIAVASLQPAYAFSLRQMFVLFLGITTTGMLISVFQFYTTKRVFLSLQALLLDDYPEMLIERDKGNNDVGAGIKAKFQRAMILLATVLVILTAVAASASFQRGLQMQVGSLYMDTFSREADSLGKLVEIRADPQLLQFYLDRMRPEGDDTFILVDENLKNLLGVDLDPGKESLIRIILKGAGWTLESRRPTVHSLGNNIYTAVVSREVFTVIHLPLDGSDLFVLSPTSHFSGAVRSMYAMVFAVIGIALLLSFVYGKFSAEEIQAPLNSIMVSIQAMARGDLTQNVHVTGRDELGVVAKSLARAIFSLRRLIGKIENASNALEDSAETIQALSGEVATGSQSQAQAVDDTSQSMEEMKGAVESIAESIQTLASSTEESSASILQVQATIEEVASSVDNLSAGVEQTTASIQEMNSSIKEVAENVQYLTRKSEEAMGALAEMEKMIGQVTEGSKQTALISDQVNADAKNGARAVEQTIKGIDRIQSTSQAVADVITRLGKKAQEIGSILNVIEDVTEETNLLALNAAIIAAQAGEHGRGFSVVADEIKDLAERTSSSTQEIAALIESVQEDSTKAVEKVKEDMSSIEEGVNLAQQAGWALEKIEESVQKALEQTKAIAKAASVQAVKSRNVLEFMDGINSLVAQVAQATQEQSKSGDQISSASERMEQISHQVKRATQEQTHGSRQITQAIEHIAEITNYINNAQRDQLSSTDRVRQAVQGIKSIAGENQARVDEMSEKIDNLNRLADDLKELLGEFSI